MTDNWSRRKFTKAVISAQAFLASGAFVLPLSCIESNKEESDGPLNHLQQTTLKFAMDEIIPASSKMPSASAIGGLQYVLNILEELPELVPLFIGVTDKIQNQSIEQSGGPFSRLIRNDRIAILTALEQSEPPLFKILKEFTYESYYINKEVFELIKYEPHPTGTAGPNMEPFDEKLLDRVKASPPFYTKI
jgi:hypothetical protein